MNHTPALAALLAAGLLLPGCAFIRDGLPPSPPIPYDDQCERIRPTVLVLLPGKDGKAGAVDVSDGTSIQTLSTALAAVHVAGGRALPVAVTDSDVNRIFGAAIAAQPIRPERFRLYFQEGSTNLTPDSERAFAAVFDDVKRRPDYQVEVIGHTDRVGDADFNLALSHKRAEVIRARLIERGIAANSVSSTGRGEGDLLVATPDRVAEGRNRRVEIFVR